MIHINICADDYALTPKVSAGILELIADGRISGTSVMAASEYWAETSTALIKYKGNADIGIHLTLTDLQPITSMPKFAPQGKFPELKKLIKLAYLRQLPLAEIRQELIEQLQRFYLYFGAWPSHMDGHHHIHVLPGIREIVIELFSKFIGEAGYLRNCYATPVDIIRRGIGWSKAAVISLLSLPLKLQLNQLGVATNSSFAGAYNFSSDEAYSEIFSKLLAGAKDNLLIMIHPGYADEILRGLDPVVEGREQELRFFQSEHFLQIMLEHGLSCQKITTLTSS